MSKYPTGVENHGGTLRLWFIYKGSGSGKALAFRIHQRTGRLLASFAHQYAMRSRPAPSSTRRSFLIRKICSVSGRPQEVTIGELSGRWLALKEMEVAESSLNTYGRVIANVMAIPGGTLLSSITKESILEIRKELLTGYQVMKKGHKTAKKGRSSVTVNNYMTVWFGIFQFAVENGYISRSPMTGVAPLRESRPDPDPITREEFPRLIDACHHQQSKIFGLSPFTPDCGRVNCADWLGGCGLKGRDYHRQKEPDSERDIHATEN